MLKMPREARLAWAMAAFMLICSVLLMLWGLLAQQRAWRAEHRIQQLELEHREDVEQLRSDFESDVEDLQRQLDKLDEFWKVDSRNLWVSVRTLQGGRTNDRDEDQEDRDGVER